MIHGLIAAPHRLFWRHPLLTVIVIALLTCLVPVKGVLAHAADVYLQASYITIAKEQVTVELAISPSFIGVQPGTYTGASGETIRPHGDIADDAFALVNALDATQQQRAILGSSSIDLVLGPGQDGKTLQAEGLAGAQMNADQQAAFLKLISHYTGLANDQAATARLAAVQAVLADTYLAWYGPTTAGSAAYFRIAGPTIVIEYSPQSMGGDPANHIHGIYRDPTNDYGAALIQ